MSTKSTSPTRQTYFWVYAWTMLLLALTTGLAFVKMGAVWNEVIAVTLGAVKMVLILLFYMKLKYSSNVMRTVAGAGLLWFMILISLTMSDYLSRGWIPIQGP